MGNGAPRRYWLCWSGDVTRGILLTGCNPGMNGCIECQTYWCGHRARLEPDRFKAIWYSTTELLSHSWISQSLCVLRRQMVPSPKLGGQERDGLPS